MAKPSNGVRSTRLNNTENKTQNDVLHKKKSGSAPLPDTSSKINKRIRDIKRTLSMPNVPLKVKVESERRLIQLKYLYGERKIDEKEKEIAKKYHKVKHFERKKVNRKLKKLRNRIDETDDKEKLTELDKEIQEALLDELYIDNFPKTLPYASLYATNDNDEKRLSKKQEIRQEIKEAADSGNGFDDLQAKYRQQWRTMLIKQGAIEDATPVMVEDEVMDQADTTTNEQQQQQQQDSELKDDFFE